MLWMDPHPAIRLLKGDSWPQRKMCSWNNNCPFGMAGVLFLSVFSSAPSDLFQKTHPKK